MKRPVKKVRRFCEEYIIDFNGTRAAKTAGFSEKSAHVQACRMLKKDNVRAYIEELQQRLMDRSMITAERVVLELAKMAFYNSKDYFSWGGGGITIMDSEGLSLDQTAAVTAVEERKTIGKRLDKDDKEIIYNVTTKIHLADKRMACRDLGDHLGIFKKRVEIDDPNGSLLNPVKEVLKEIADTERGFNFARPNGNGHKEPVDGSTLASE